MSKIDQILQIQSIDGAAYIKAMVRDWSSAEVVQFYRELKELKENQK